MHMSTCAHTRTHSRTHARTHTHTTHTGCKRAHPEVCGVQQTGVLGLEQARPLRALHPCLGGGGARGARALRQEAAVRQARGDGWVPRGLDRLGHELVHSYLAAQGRPCSGQQCSKSARPTALPLSAALLVHSVSRHGMQHEGRPQAPGKHVNTASQHWATLFSTPQNTKHNQISITPKYAHGAQAHAHTHTHMRTHTLTRTWNVQHNVRPKCLSARCFVALLRVANHLGVLWGTCACMCVCVCQVECVRVGREVREGKERLCSQALCCGSCLERSTSL